MILSFCLTRAKNISNSALTASVPPVIPSKNDPAHPPYLVKQLFPWSEEWGFATGIFLICFQYNSKELIVSTEYFIPIVCFSKPQKPLPDLKYSKLSFP